jgi:hypothetical protein
MRRAVVVLTLVGAAVAGFAAPAVAKPPVPPVPVGVGQDSHGDVCVYGFSWVPFCLHSAQ